VANRTKITPKKRETFLSELRLDGNVSRAARVCGARRETFYAHRNEDEAFKAEWEAAVELGEANARDVLEEEAHRRALDGSDTLLMFRLKKLDPSYREKHDINTTGEVSIVVRYAND
jgi:hypothetical protein